MTDTTYQGWSNRATWNVALWLNNDYSLYRGKEDLAKRYRDSEDRADQLTAFAGELRQYAKDTWPNGETPDNARLSECNWRELAQSEMEV
jgi:hypothetical protein